MKKKSMYIFIIIAILIIAGIITFCVFKKADKNTNKNEIVSNENSSNLNSESDVKSDISSDDGSSSTDNEEVKKNYDQNATFEFSVTNYTKDGNSASVSGTIEGGILKVNESVKLIGKDLSSGTAAVSNIKKNGENVESAVAGDQIEITLGDVNDSNVKEVSKILEHGEIKNITKCQAKIYVLTAEEGGKSTPMFHNYRDYVKFENFSEVIGIVKLPLDEGVEMINPGEFGTVEIDLERLAIAEDNETFEIKKSKTVIARGIIEKVIE